LAQAAKAHEMLDGSHTRGKIVLVPSQPFWHLQLELCRLSTA
jgi:hypothetical protein